MPALAPISFYVNDIADKLASDARLVELVDLIGNTEEKIRNLSIADKKLLKKYGDQSNIAEIAKLYTKAAIDYKKVSLQKMVIINELDKKYGLNKLSNKEEVINLALRKMKTPFAQCLLGLMIGALGCEAFSGDYYFACIIAVEAAYLGCIFALD